MPKNKKPKEPKRRDKLDAKAQKKIKDKLKAKGLPETLADNEDGRVVASALVGELRRRDRV